MVTLKGDICYLRALEPEDLEFVHAIENDEDNWEISNTQRPFSKYEIKKYIENAHKDIFEAKQLRLVIASIHNEPLGLIDVYDFDFMNKRAGIGLIIKNDAHKNKGYGTEALKLLADYCFKRLDLHQLYCNIAESNNASLRLFSKMGFVEIGLKKDWQFTHGKFNNEYMLQLLNTDVH